MRTRNKLWGYVLTGVLSMSAIIIQTKFLSGLPVHDVFVNLPLTLVIVWGIVFGSPLPPITPDVLRLSTFQEIFTWQMLSGSLVGLLVGTLMAALYAALLPVFPFNLPLIGWVSGYFCLRHVVKQNWLCIPLVFVLSLFGETLMAWQLAITGHTYVFEHLYHIALPEAVLNSVIAPFIYFPMRRWFDFAQVAQTPLEH